MPKNNYTGLNESQVTANRLKYGLNIIESKKHNFILDLIKQVLVQPMVILLTCAALIYFLIGQSNEAIIKPIVPFFHFHHYSIQKPNIACYYFYYPGCILSLCLYPSGSTFISVY